MNLEFNSAREVLLVVVKGEMDMATADEIRVSIDAQLQKEKTRYLLLDLSGVSFLDSSGIGVILGRYRNLNRIGGKVAIIKPQITARRVLEMAGVDRLMPICENESEGLKVLTGLNSPKNSEKN